MAKPKRAVAVARSTRLVKQVSQELGFQPKLRDLLEARIALGAGAKLSKERADFIARALKYLARILIVEHVSHRPGRRAKMDNMAAVVFARQLHENQGKTVEAAILQALENRAEKDYESVRTLYYTKSKAKPPKNK